MGYWGYTKPGVESRQDEDFRTSVAIIVLAVFFVILRFIARNMRQMPYGADDFILLVAVAFLFAAFGLVLTLIHYGMGMHVYDLPPENVAMVSKLLISFESVYCTTVGIIKLSILAMYCRIFITRGFRLTAYILGAVTIGWVISIVFVSVFQCVPVAKTWTPELPGHCINLKASFIGNAVPNIVTDIIILSLPVTRVWKLNASLTHRLSVIFVFGLGSFVVFTSIYRFTTLFEFRIEDAAWTIAKPTVWCLIEVASGVISACLPTLRPLFQLISSRFDSIHVGSKLTGKGVDSTMPTTTNTVTTKRRSLPHMAGALFRPDSGKDGVRQNITSKGDGASWSGDEVPLHGIRVDRDWDVASARSSTGPNEKV